MLCWVRGSALSSSRQRRRLLRFSPPPTGAMSGAVEPKSERRLLSHPQTNKVAAKPARELLSFFSLSQDIRSRRLHCVRSIFRASETTSTGPPFISLEVLALTSFDGMGIIQSKFILGFKEGNASDVDTGSHNWRSIQLPKLLNIFLSSQLRSPVALEGEKSSVYCFTIMKYSVARIGKTTARTASYGRCCRIARFQIVGSACPRSLTYFLTPQKNSITPTVFQLLI